MILNDPEFNALMTDHKCNTFPEFNVSHKMFLLDHIKANWDIVLYRTTKDYYNLEKNHQNGKKNFSCSTLLYLGPSFLIGPLTEKIVAKVKLSVFSFQT